MSREISLVCFDWGGVILRICRSWSEGCQRAGLPLRVPPERLAAPDLLAIRRAAADDYQAGRLDDGAYFEAVRRGVGGAYTRDEIARVHDAWLIGEYEGIDDLLARLHATPGVSTALLSNTNPRHWARQHPGHGYAGPHFPAIRRLRHAHASHLLGVTKPDPSIYAEFERRTGHRGRQILFFDDLPENVAAARAAGWYAELIDHTSDTAAQIDRHLRTLGVW